MLRRQRGTPTENYAPLSVIAAAVMLRGAVWHCPKPAYTTATASPLTNEATKNAPYGFAPAIQLRTAEGRG